MKRILVLIVALLFSYPAFAATPLGNPIPSVPSASVEGSHIFKTTSGVLTGFNVTSGASAGYVLIFDSATVPADGAVTPMFCYSLAAATTGSSGWLQYPVPFTNGIVMVFSTTGCFTKTISNTAFFSAQIQ